MAVMFWALVKPLGGKVFIICINLGNLWAAFFLRGLGGGCGEGQGFY